MYILVYLDGSYTCEFKIGGGNNYTKIGDYKQDECLKACLKQKRINNAFNGIGVYVDQSKSGCWCLKYMPSRNNYHEFKSCTIQEKGKVKYCYLLRLQIFLQFYHAYSAIRMMTSLFIDIFL